jgi:tetratricopeptide (TPR) repeat protein
LGKTDPLAALRAVQHALQILDEDLQRNPKDRLLRSRRARALRHLSYALERNQRHSEARRALEQAIEIQQQLLAETATDASEREQVALTRKVLASLSNHY